MQQKENVVHVTKGQKEGDLIIHKCEICGYHVEINGMEMKTKSHGDLTVMHQGTYVSPSVFLPSVN